MKDKLVLISLIVFALLAINIVSLAQAGNGNNMPPELFPNKITINVNAWYTLPYFTYGQSVGEVYVTGQLNLESGQNYTSARFNFTSEGFLLTQGGLKALPIDRFVVGVFPTGDGVYVLALNVSAMIGNVTNSSNKTVVNVTPTTEELWYYNGNAWSLVLKGNITSLLPSDEGVYAVEEAGGKYFLIYISNGKVVSNATLPENLFLIYKGNGYLLASTTALSVSPTLLAKLAGFGAFNANSSSQFTEVKFYKIFQNGTMVEVRPNINTTNATLVVLPGNLYGATVYVEYPNGTHDLYLYNGTTLLKIASGYSNTTSSFTGRSFLLPLVLTAQGIIAYSTVSINFQAMLSGGNLLSSSLSLLVNVNGSWVNYGTLSINGVPLAMTKNGSQVTVYYLTVTPSYSLANNELVVTISTSVIPTSVYVGGPVPVSYEVSVETLQGAKYLVITWTKPSMNVIENVSVYVSVNGGPFELVQEVPLSVGVAYFQLPENATTVSVYLVVKNAMGSLPLSTESVGVSNTTTTTTVTSPQTSTSTSTTSTFTTQSSSTASQTQSTSTTSSISSPNIGLEGAIGVAVAVIIVAVVVVFLLRKGK